MRHYFPVLLIVGGAGPDLERSLVEKKETRTAPLLALADFLGRWRREIEKGSASDDVWERAIALKQLKKRGLLEAITFHGITGEPGVREDWRARGTVEALLHEVENHRILAKMVKSQNSAFKDVENFLRRMEGHFKKQAKVSSVASAKTLLLNRARTIAGDRQKIEDDRSKAWRSTRNSFTLFADGALELVPETARVPFTYRDPRAGPSVEIGSIADAQAEADDKPQPVPLPSREIDVDFAIQKRVGRILRSLLRPETGVPLKTICRLVMLFYIVSELAVRQGHELVITRYKRNKKGDEKPFVLAVFDIEQRLRRDGMK